MESTWTREVSASRRTHAKGSAAGRAFGRGVGRRADDGRRCKPGDFQTPVIQSVDIASFHIRDKKNPFSIRVHSIKAAEKRCPRVGRQHVCGAGPARVRGPGTGQGAADRATKLGTINMDVAIRGSVVESQIKAFVAVTQVAGGTASHTVQ